MMKEKINRIYEWFLRNPKAQAALEHFIKPLAATLFLAFFYFVIIYYKNDNTTYKDRFFLYAAFLVPLAINIALTFIKMPRLRLGALYGVSVAAAPMLAIMYFQFTSKYSLMPQFYFSFVESGAFYVLYIIYAIFFAIGGMFFGLIDEYLPFDEKKAILKIQETEKQQLSKAKRRKLKKKRREDAKNLMNSANLVDEVIGRPEDGEEEGESAEDESDSDLEDEGEPGSADENENAAKSKEKNDRKNK